MKPSTIKKLTEEVPEFRELLAFLATEVQKLDTLVDFNGKDDRVIAIETIGKHYARETLLKILEPLLNTNTLSTALSMSSEYAVDV